MDHLSTRDIAVTASSTADLVQWASARRRHGSPLSGRVYKCLLAQVAVFEGLTLRSTADGSPLVIAGCVDLEPGVASEIFFLSRSGGLGGLLIGVHRIALRWLAEVAATRPAGLVCFVRPDNANGRRFARALGFCRDGVCFEDFERWRWRRGDGKDGQGV